MIFSYSLHGLEASMVQLEFQVRSGLPYFAIIGLASQSVQEAKDRVRCALEQAGFRCPMERKIVNIAPADVHKHGTHFDLPIAIGLLLESAQLAPVKKKYLYAGELGLKGELKEILGALPLFILAKKLKMPLIIPKKTAERYAWVEGVEIAAFDHLNEVVDFLEGRAGSKPIKEHGVSNEFDGEDAMALLYGHESLQKILAVAVGGGHHVRMVGPPGAGKSMLARSMRALLPPLQYQERMELEALYSLCDRSHLSMYRAPFREIGPSCTFSGLFGGGVPLRPGEVSLAHHGILFMDELPEFARTSLEAFRPILESGFVHVRHAKQEAKFPASFQWVTAMNPCPCAYDKDPNKACRCHPFEKLRYQQKLSGPLLDRIDIHIGLQSESFSVLHGAKAVSYDALREAVFLMREIQKKRASMYGYTSNRDLDLRWLKQEKLESDLVHFLDELSHKSWSTRRLLRMMRLARSLADFDAKEHIDKKHFYEAYSFQKNLELL